MDSKKQMLALALMRAPLRTRDRFILWDRIEEMRELTEQSRTAIERMLWRRLESTWDSDRIAQMALEDAKILAAKGARIIQFDDPAYPLLLRETSRPPFALYARGEIRDVNYFAIVGTRMPTNEAMKETRDLAAEIAKSGMCILSGLAKGIDCAAHEGALRVKGLTCASIPCGIDDVYPRSHRALAMKILNTHGLILSEYPPGCAVQRFHFPERNRIIAGMARAVLVSEAPEKSGALITVDHALDEGREVCVLGNRLGGPRSAGIDRLAADGATIVTSAQEILDLFGLDSSGFAIKVDTGAESKKRSIQLNLVESLSNELGQMVKPQQPGHKVPAASKAAEPEDPGRQNNDSVFDDCGT